MLPIQTSDHTENIIRKLQHSVTRFTESGRVMPNFHKEPEIIYVAMGSITVKIQGREFIVKEEQFILIMPNMLHEIVYNVGVDFWIKHFEKDEADYLFNNSYSSNLISAVFECQRKVSSFYYHYCLNPERVLQSRIVQVPDDEAYIQRDIYNAYLYSLKCLLKACMDKSTVNIECRKAEMYLHKVLKHISEKSANHTSMVEFAKSIGDIESNQRRRLARVVRKFGYDYTYSDLVYIYRVELAQRMVATGDYTLTEIAKRCGFINITRMRKFFIKYLYVNLDALKKHYYNLRKLGYRH